MTPVFGIIAEGKTDHEVLRNILAGFFNDRNIDIIPLQPSQDFTDGSQLSEFGGWFNVFEYCRSGYLVNAVEQNDFIIIQIDSDCSHELHFGVLKEKEETLEVFVERIRNRLKSVITDKLGDDWFEKYSKRIIFAIAVDEIECWLLPLFYTDKIKSVVNNCIYKLNQKLSERDKINPDAKDVNTYRRISRDFSKPKILNQFYPKNPSLKIFIEELKSKVGAEMAI